VRRSSTQLNLVSIEAHFTDREYRSFWPDFAEKPSWGSLREGGYWYVNGTTFPVIASRFCGNLMQA